MDSEICEKLKLDTEDTRNQPQVGDECPLKDCDVQGLRNIIIVYIILAPRFMLANFRGEARVSVSVQPKQHPPTTSKKTRRFRHQLIFTPPVFSQGQ
jgi:hypothetical protein